MPANPPKIQIKRGSTAPANNALLVGELAADLSNKVVYIGQSNGTALAIGGEGIFATKAYADSAASSATSTGNAATATKLETARTISLSADATGSANFDGSANADIAVTLANSGVTAGTHTKVTVNAKGLVTTGANLDAADIPTLTAAKISDFDTQVQTSRLDQMAAPTASVSLNSQKITNLADPAANTDASTKGYVDTKISDLVNGAGTALDTLKELADALGNDANFATTITTSIGEKLAKASNLSDLADASTARTNLGLGSIATQNSNSVSITGGAISFVTLSDLTIDCGSY
jgi:hypothetical protein